MKTNHLMENPLLRAAGAVALTAVITARMSGARIPLIKRAREVPIPSAAAASAATMEATQWINEESQVTIQMKVVRIPFVAPVIPAIAGDTRRINDDAAMMIPGKAAQTLFVVAAVVAAAIKKPSPSLTQSPKPKPKPKPSLKISQKL